MALSKGKNLPHLSVYKESPLLALVTLTDRSFDKLAKYETLINILWSLPCFDWVSSPFLPLLCTLSHHLMHLTLPIDIHGAEYMLLWLLLLLLLPLSWYKFSKKKKNKCNKVNFRCSSIFNVTQNWLKTESFQKTLALDPQISWLISTK